MATLSYVSTLNFNAGENGIGTAKIDPANGFIYAGCTWSNHIVKVRLSDFTEVASIGSAISYKQGSEIDLVNQFFYLGSNQVPSRASKVDLSSFTEVANIVTGGNVASAFVIDVAGGFVYCADNTIRKIRLSDFTLVNSLVPTLQVSCSAIDNTNHFAYFGGYTPNSVYKLNLTTFTKQAQLNFVDGEQEIMSGVIDVQNGFSYWGDYGTYVVKVRLSDFTKVDRISLAGTPWEAAIDVPHKFAYFATGSNPSTLVKIDLTTFSQVESIVITGSYNLNAILIDPTTGFIYCCSAAGATVPGKIIKVLDTDLVPPTTNITGRSQFSSRGASVSGGISAGKGKRRR